MIRIRLLICAGILATPAYPQNVAVPNSHTDRPAIPGSAPRHPKADATANAEVRSLLDDAQALPPEFISDVSLQLVENGLIKNDRLRSKVLDDAFENASSAQDDVMRRPWGTNVEETPQGLHAIASDYTGLDRISLQTRVVREVFSKSPQHARELFESIKPLQITPIPCNEPWFFAPKTYYDAAAMVSARGFSPREIAGGTRSSFVSSIVRNMQTPLQFAPIVQFLNEGQLTDQELREIISVLLTALRTLPRDPWSFKILASEPDGFFEAISKLIALLNKNNIESRPPISAVRDYLVLNFKQPGCSSGNDARKPNSALPSAARQFNQQFARELTRANLGPIQQDEIRKVDGADIDTPPPARWNSNTYAQLLLSLQSVNPPKRSDDSRWMQQVRDLLMQLNAWSRTDEPETEFFHQKAILLEGLAERTIGTSLHPEVLDRFIAFLEQYSYEQVSPVDWFLFAKKLLLVASVQPGTAKVDLQAFLNCREPVLTVYARLMLLIQDSKKPRTSANPGDLGA